MADDYLEQLAAEIDMENTYRSRITSGDGSESAGLRAIIPEAIWKQYDDSVDKAHSVGAFKELKRMQAKIGALFIDAALAPAISRPPTQGSAQRGLQELPSENIDQLAFNLREHLVPANRLIDGIDPDDLTRKIMYQRPGESMFTANVGGWYHTAVYWRHRALAQTPSASPGERAGK